MQMLPPIQGKEEVAMSGKRVAPAGGTQTVQKKSKAVWIALGLIAALVIGGTAASARIRAAMTRFSPA